MCCSRRLRWAVVKSDLKVTRAGECTLSECTDVACMLKLFILHLMLGVDGPCRLIIITGWGSGRDGQLQILGSTTNECFWLVTAFYSLRQRCSCSFFCNIQQWNIHEHNVTILCTETTNTTNTNNDK